MADDVLLTCPCQQWGLYASCSPHSAFRPILSLPCVYRRRCESATRKLDTNLTHQAKTSNLNYFFAGPSLSRVNSRVSSSVNIAARQEKRVQRRKEGKEAVSSAGGREAAATARSLAKRLLGQSPRKSKPIVIKTPPTRPESVAPSFVAYPAAMGTVPSVTANATPA